MKDFFFFFQLTVIVSAAVLVVLKTVHYSLTIRRKTLINWFYFNFFSIVNSPTEASENAKRLQNRFTLSIILLVLLTGSSLLVNRILLLYFPTLFT